MITENNLHEMLSLATRLYEHFDKHKATLMVRHAAEFIPFGVYDEDVLYAIVTKYDDEPPVKIKDANMTELYQMAIRSKHAMHTLYKCAASNRGKDATWSAVKQAVYCFCGGSEFIMTHYITNSKWSDEWIVAFSEASQDICVLRTLGVDVLKHADSAGDPAEFVKLCADQRVKFSR